MFIISFFCRSYRRPRRKEKRTLLKDVEEPIKMGIDNVDSKSWFLSSLSMVTILVIFMFIFSSPMLNIIANTNIPRICFITFIFLAIANFKTNKKLFHLFLGLAGIVVYCVLLIYGIFILLLAI